MNEHQGLSKGVCYKNHSQVIGHNLEDNRNRRQEFEGRIHNGVWFLKSWASIYQLMPDSFRIFDVDSRSQENGT